MSELPDTSRLSSGQVYYVSNKCFDFHTLKYQIQLVCVIY